MKKFIVINSGDWDVGLKGFQIEFCISDDDEILSDHDGFESRMKEFLKKEFELEDGRTSIMTQEEFDNLEKSYCEREEGNNLRE